MKKTLSALLALVLILTSVPVFVFNVFAGPAEYTYTHDATNATITKYNGSGSIITVPKILGGYNVTAIANDAFKDKNTLTKVTIQDGLTTIGKNAFSACENLAEVIISKTVSKIDTMAFSQCSALKKITVSSDNPTYSSKGGVLFNKVKTVIYICPGGEPGKYVIPYGVTTIEDHAFYSCNALTGVSIPGTVSTIKSNAFLNCNGIKSLVFPSSVKSIGSYAFADCTQLAKAYFFGNAPALGTQVFTNNADSIMIYYISGKTGFKPHLSGCPTATFKPVSSIKLSLSTLKLTAGKSVTLTATVMPADASNKAVSWSSSKTTVATVSSVGKVTAKAVGTATITCTAKDGSGKKATCIINVKP